ncbi:glycosyl hydrolase family 18 protein [Pseudomonas sp. 148P]|uniref:chitinase n=1 Tax=Pseudomonas ulcerans TaxID=3115852 RepID=A0ABU7HYI7_9PSED|nr:MULTISPECIES: glycosyl hydrolase family 18 protein [unclassified Pseudomonas]MEE1925205.1 glycosyl hydrolase family 18 protein [Pseudomonas sp. 147P]MEE1936639.1 glycosyl hydrolase family 18 protein [Pseudomonas sp. 148P]
MQEKDSDGLQFLFEKNRGVDTLYLYNNGKSPFRLKELQVQTNVFVGTGTPRNLTEETGVWLLLPGGSIATIENDQKLAYLRSRFKGSPDVTAKAAPDVETLYDDYFCPWGRLGQGQGLRLDRGDHYLLCWTYKDAVEIGPYEQVALSYANSFDGLPMRSPIAGVQCLPRVFVRPDIDTAGLKGIAYVRATLNPPPLRELALEQLILRKENGEPRVLDRSTADKARSADLTRRFVGYYANYFMYQRDYFVTDIPVDHVNCISYGMMSVQDDGSLCSSDEWSDNFQMAGLQFLKQLNPDLQVSLIVGGWPKSPNLYFNTASSFPSNGASPDGSFMIVQLVQQNQWEVHYNPPSGSPGYGTTRTLRIDREVSPYADVERDPQGLFDDGASTRGLYTWLLKHGASLQGRVLDLGNNENDSLTLDADLELMSLLGKAFGAQSDIAPFANRFRQVSRNPGQRERFARSAATAINALGFDGFEVDWEYPKVVDGQGYVDMLKDLRTALGDKQLAIAAPGGSGNISQLNEDQWRKVGELIDHVNVMSYDYHGGWDTTKLSWFNAPLDTPDSAAGHEVEPRIEKTFCVNETLRIFLHLVARNCLTRRQLTLGLAGYGRAVRVDGIDDTNQGLRCPVLARAEPGEPQYREIVAMREAGGYRAEEAGKPAIGWPGLKFVSALDPIARAPFAYSSLSGISLTYDDPRSLREKVRRVLEEQLGGVMIWDLSDDMPTTHKDSLIAAVSDELRQCHPAVARLREDEQDPWLVAARANEPLVAPVLANQVVEYGATPVSQVTDLGGQSIEALASLPGGSIAAIDANGLRLLAVQDQGFLTQRTLAFAEAPVARCMTLPLNDGRLLVCRGDGRVLVVHLQDGQCQVETELASGIHAMTSAGPNRVAVLQGQRLLVWRLDAAGFEQTHRVDHPGYLTALAPLVGGQLLLVSNDGEAFLWQDGAAALRPLSLAATLATPYQLQLLPDGRLLAWLPDGALQLWQVLRQDGQLQRLEVTALSWSGGPREWLDMRVLPSGGFASLDRQRLMLWQANPATHGYEVIQQLTVPQATALGLLDDGNLLVAQGQRLQRLTFPGWPRVQAARCTPWQVTDKDGLTALHWLAKGSHASNLEQTLASGAPVDLWQPGSDKTVLAEAMRAKRPEATAMLLSAGAPLWQTEHAVSHGQLFDAELFAELLPASLIAALPAENRIARLKPGFDLTQLPGDWHDLLLGYPMLTGRMAIGVYLLVPDLARQLQNLLSHFEIDDDCLAELRQECPQVVAAVEPLHGRSFFDDASLCQALGPLGETDPAALDAVRNASRRVKSDLGGEGHYGQAVYEKGIEVLQGILDQALQQPLLALQRKQLLEQFAELAAPQPGDLLILKADLVAADLPAATIDFLTLYPRAAAPMAAQLRLWSPALADLVSACTAGTSQQSDADIPDEAADSAHRALRQLLVATVRPVMTQTQAADFLARYADAPWAPRRDPLGQPLAWVNWAFDPPASRAFTDLSGQPAETSSGGGAWQMPGQTASARTAQQTTPGAKAPGLDDKRSYIARIRASSAAMAEKSKAGKDSFAGYMEATRAKVESAHPLTERIRYAKIEIDGNNRQITVTKGELEAFGDLHTDQDRYAFAAKNSGAVPDPSLSDEQKQQYVKKWQAEKKTSLNKNYKAVENRRKDVERMQEQRIADVNADPRMQALAKRKASLKKLNGALDNTREVLQGVQALSKFTRLLNSKLFGDNETVNKVLDYLDLSVNIAIVAVDTIKSISSALSTGGAMGVFGVITSVVSLTMTLVGLFNPQPDPYLEAAKAISEQITQVYEVMNQRFDQVMDQLQSMSWQMSVFSHQVDARFDGMQRQLEDMAASLNRQLEHLDAALASGLRMTRREIRESTQQVLASIVWSHDDLVNRMDLANLGFKADLQGLNALMSTQLLADLDEIDVTIANAERERVKTPTLVALEDDPARLRDMRDRLESGIRNKLLAGGVTRPLADLCFTSFDNGEVMNAARVMANDHFAECFAFYYAAQETDHQDRSSKVWNSTAVAFPLTRRFLHLQGWYAGWLDNPLSVLVSVAELVDTPVARARQFLVGLQQDKAFFSGLLDRYLDAALALLHASREVTVREFGQTLRLPSLQLTDTSVLLPLMFDRFPRLALTDLALDTLETDQPQRRDQDIAALQTWFDAPAGNWRLQKLCRALALGHALNVCELRLSGSDTTRLLVMRYGSEEVPLVSMSVQDERVLSVTSVQRDNGLFVSLGEDCRQVQQQWIAAYNRRIPLDCAAELKALDGVVSQLALFLGLAGASAQQIEQVLGLCWNSQGVAAYLSAQAGLTALGKDQVSPPFALLAGYTGQLAQQADEWVAATLTALAANPSRDEELPSLRDALLAQLDLLDQQTRDLRSELAGDDLTALLRAKGIGEEEGLLHLTAEQLYGGFSIEMGASIVLRQGCRLTLAGSGRFDLTCTDGAGSTVVRAVDLDVGGIVQLELAGATGEEQLASLGFGASQEAGDVWLEGLWLKEAEASQA